MKRWTWILLTLMVVTPLSASGVQSATARTSSLTSALKALTGLKSPIWHLRLVSIHPRDAPSMTVGKSLKMVLMPYKSSKRFCRTYAVSGHRPGVSVDTEKSYDLEASLYVALDTKGRPCNKLSFSKDYFSINRGMADQSVQQLLDALHTALDRWNKIHDNKECAGHPATIHQLQTIVIAPEPAGSGTVEYWLRCGYGTWRVFDVWLDENNKFVGYNSSLVMH